ncbi:hypothetical protein RhiirC2_841294 [Rhizophagus irregularis]|uniref:BTB domain-containing protein n=1 Tax=Rhizophagus irregularis TaxID=588596 RepID=A0A2N1P477_9GLOM|nr:hypothetical protein RhiirC2_841294 [Rhizophagus irregularis]
MSSKSAEILVNRLIKNFDYLYQNPNINYDTIIKVGNGSNSKTFFAHALILTSQSTYFRIALSSGWIKKEGDKIVFEKPNISPKNFEIILKHLYSGTVSLDELTPCELLDLLCATDEFMLTELMNFAESHLLSLADTWIKTDFIKVQFHAHRFVECKNLQEFCIQKMSDNPELIFKSSDFINLSGDLLIDLLKRDDIEMDEVEIWKYVVKWGIHKCSNSERDVNEWEEKDFNELWEILKDYVELIRFGNISSEDFSSEVKPYLRHCFAPRHQSRLSRRGKHMKISIDEISKISRELKSEYIFVQNDYILAKFLIYK